MPDQKTGPLSGRLQDRVALVTGAASGLGLACAQRFAHEGAVVVGLDINTNEGWSESVETAAQSRFFTVDVTDLAALESIVSDVLAAFGRIDILVTAAGVAGGGPVHLVDEEAWDRVQNINLKGTFLSAKAVLPAMIEQRSGSIITLASVEGLEGTEGGSAYNASKGGVVLLSKNMAIDYGRVGIRCNAICPGFIETPMFSEVMDSPGFESYKEGIRQQHKLGRFGKAEEIAGAAFFLASDDSSFVTGQALAVDGGYTAGHSYGIVSMMGLD